MGAGPWQFTDTSKKKLFDGSTFRYGTDTFKCALFLSTSNLSSASTTYAGLTNEHANANGYTTGGVTVTMALTGTTSIMLDCDDPTWTTSGGNIVARYAVIYETSGDILCWCLLDTTPADVTATLPAQFIVSIPSTGLIAA